MSDTSSQRVKQLPKWILIMALSPPVMAVGFITSVEIATTTLAGLMIMTFGVFLGVLQTAWRAKNV